jgi:prophage regulatory protein
MPISTVTSDRILRLRQVSEITGLGRSSLYNRIAAGLFPKQFPLGGRAVGWLASEIESWIASQVAASRCQENRLAQQ